MYWEMATLVVGRVVASSHNATASTPAQRRPTRTTVRMGGTLTTHALTQDCSQSEPGSRTEEMICPLVWLTALAAPT